MYLARDLRPAEAPDGFVKEGEEAEMELSWAPLADLVDAVLAGDLHNPTMVSGVLAAWVAQLKGDDFARCGPPTHPGRRATIVRPAETDPTGPVADLPGRVAEEPMHDARRHNLKLRRVIPGARMSKRSSRRRCPSW